MQRSGCLFREQSITEETIKVTEAPAAAGCDIPTEPVVSPVVSTTVSPVVAPLVSTGTITPAPVSVNSSSSSSSGNSKREFWLDMGARLGVVSVMFSFFLTYICVHFYAGLFYWLFTGEQASAYMQASRDSSTIGMLLAFFLHC